MKFFTNCKNLDELKKTYRAAAFANHPDRGGDTAIMQAINAEYTERFEALKRQQNSEAKANTTGTKHVTSESAGDFISIVNIWMGWKIGNYLLQRKSPTT